MNVDGDLGDDHGDHDDHDDHLSMGLCSPRTIHLSSVGWSSGNGWVMIMVI